MVVAKKESRGKTQDIVTKALSRSEGSLTTSKTDSALQYTDCFA